MNALEKPHYGRTGLLASKMGGLPVTQPRLIVPGQGGNNTNPSTSPTASSAATTRSLKWYPSLLTIPQQLLDALHAEDEESVEDFAGTHLFSSDPTLITYLRVATIAEYLVAHARQKSKAALSRGQIASLYAAVLEWGRAQLQGSSSVLGEVYFPSYKLLVMREGQKVAEYPDLTKRAVWLLGKEPVVNDIALDHPSCSGQHAALEMRFVVAEEAPLLALLETTKGESTSGFPAYIRSTSEMHATCKGLWEVLLEQQEAAGGDGSAVWTAELQLTDLGSTNRTKLNGEVLPPLVPTTVIESDVMEFGCSTRKYVVMRSG